MPHTELALAFALRYIKLLIIGQYTEITYTLNFLMSVDRAHTVMYKNSLYLSHVWIHTNQFIFIWLDIFICLLTVYSSEGPKGSVANGRQH